MARGILTDEVRKLSKELTGEEFTLRQLRLLPYLMYCLMDNCNLSPVRVNEEEREILIEWKNRGYISDMVSDYKVSSEFYDIMVQILKIGYCDAMIYDQEAKNI